MIIEAHNIEIYDYEAIEGMESFYSFCHLKILLYLAMSPYQEEIEDITNGSILFSDDDGANSFFIISFMDQSFKFFGNKRKRGTLCNLIFFLSEHEGLEVGELIRTILLSNTR
jgi:hypothetical protein